MTNGNEMTTTNETATVSGIEVLPNGTVTVAFESDGMRIEVRLSVEHADALSDSLAQTISDARDAKII